MLEMFAQNGIFCAEQEPMARHTSFQIGGPADWFVRPVGKEQLKTALSLVQKEKVSYFILGNGSNLLVGDRGFRGAVIQPELTAMEWKENQLTCGSSILLVRAAREAAKKGLGGLEFASGIPGSVGGAVRMNAGAYGGEIKDVVRSVEYYDPATGCFETISGEELQFSYRHSVFCELPGVVICEATLALRPEQSEQILSQMEELNRRRREKQPVSLPSAGSTFKRPEGHFAAALIDRAGLRGMRVGGAQVSEKHTGFIVNTGGATAKDVKDLMHEVTKEVQRQFGVTLEAEICMIGE